MNSEHTGCQHFIRPINETTFIVGCIEHRWIEMVESRQAAQSRQAAHEKSAMKTRFITAMARSSVDTRPLREATACPVCKIEVPRGGHYHTAVEILGA
jgi:hypothetical protein